MVKKVKARRAINPEKGMNIAKDVLRPMEQTMAPVEDLIAIVKQTKPDDAVKFLEIVTKDPELLSQYGGKRGLEYLLQDLKREGYFELYPEGGQNLRSYLESAIKPESAKGVRESAKVARQREQAKQAAKKAAETKAAIREATSPVISRSLQNKINLESIIYAARLEKIDPKKRGLLNFTISGLPNNHLTAVKKLLADLTGHRDVRRATKAFDHVKIIGELAAELADKWESGQVTLTDNLLRVPIETATKMSGNPAGKRLKTIQKMISEGKPIAFAEGASSVDDAFRKSLGGVYETLQRQISAGQVKIGSKSEGLVKRIKALARPSSAEAMVRQAASEAAAPVTRLNPPMLTYSPERLPVALNTKAIPASVPAQGVGPYLGPDPLAALREELAARAAPIPVEVRIESIRSPSLTAEAAAPVTRLNPPMLTYSPERLPVALNTKAIPARVPAQGVGPYLGPDPLAALREELAARAAPIPVEARIVSIRSPYRFEMGPRRLDFTSAAAPTLTNDIELILRKAATPATRLNPPMLTYSPEWIPAHLMRIPAEAFEPKFGPDPLEIGPRRSTYIPLSEAAARSPLTETSQIGFGPIDESTEKLLRRLSKYPGVTVTVSPPGEHAIVYPPGTVRAATGPGGQGSAFIESIIGASGRATGATMSPRQKLKRSAALERLANEIVAAAGGETSEAAIRSAAAGSRAAEIERLANEIVAAAGGEVGETAAKTVGKGAGRLAKAGGAIKSAGKGAVKLAARHPVLAALIALGLTAAAYSALSGRREGEEEGAVTLLPETEWGGRQRPAATAEDVMRILAATPRYKVPVFVSPYEYRME